MEAINDDLSAADRKIIAKLEQHPARRGGSVAKALRLALDTITRRA